MTPSEIRATAEKMIIPDKVCKYFFNNCINVLLGKIFEYIKNMGRNVFQNRYTTD